MKLNLMLVRIKPYENKIGTTMYKYIFVSENNKPYVGYADQIMHEDLISDTNTFDPNRARAWEVDQDVYNDKLTYSVKIS